MGSYKLFGLGFLLAALTFNSARAAYQIGIGIADCTGPPAEIIFMGYAKLSQVGCGLHLRQFSRAYIIDDGEKRVAFVTVDTAMMGHGLRREVLKQLADLYGDTYTEQNLAISGTHTHGTPGGFLMDFMFLISTLGFAPETFNAISSGIVNSIINAHENVVEGRIFVTSGELLDANINRSPASYLENPEEERAKYQYDTDKDLVQLKFVRASDNVPIAALHWFAVHATSMNNTNCLVTSDNVGYASVLFENYMNNGALPGQGSFVGAFASSNLGDVSPNTKGPICIDTGLECDFVHSTCDGSSEFCIASGPGDNMVESTEIIATRIFNKALELWNQEDTFEVTGPVRFMHQYVDMTQQSVEVQLPNGTTIEGKGCPPAMGYAFAGGTTDGPGAFDFTQGALTDNPFWNAVRDLAFPPDQAQIDCQAPKPVLINSGQISFPFSWQPHIVSVQILSFGEIALLAVPGEFTTMSGRRIRDAVKETIINNGGSPDTRTIIAGLSNTYTNYIATYEEYGLQRYEGGSTIFGPHTLNIYIDLYKKLATAMFTGEQLDAGPAPVDFSNQLIAYAPAGNDAPHNDTNFGDVLMQPSETATFGDTVSATFVAGNPRHNLMHGGSYLTVERQVDENNWAIVANDASWETRFRWRKTDSVLATSEATIEWDIGQDVEPGTYRIRHSGNSKNAFGDITPYEGVTSSISVQ